MKPLTTLTAVAALIAGLSIASAQSPMGQRPAKSDSMGNSSTQGAKITGTDKFCITSASGDALNCKYASLAACETDAKANNQTCSTNPNTGTTGSKQ